MTCTVPDAPAGVMISDGAMLSVDEHAQSDAPQSQAAATMNERINFSQS
ncbi:MAG TPA: hypothetical protein VK601_02090 [Kofleriaceae bacterium]|nr:hypothetical protein [Kofleriaceae bacterium]